MSSASVAWKHDIGNWQSRRALSYRQQQQAMQSSTTSLARDDHGPAVGRLSGGFFSHRGKRGAAQVTFGTDVVLRTQTPAPIDASTDDVSLSALSCDVSAVSEAQRTQAFDDSVASVRQSMVNEAAEDSRMLWVTVFGVGPSQFYDVRTALHERCGPTTTHYWPALSATCNWTYVRFERSFDAAKAVSLSPIKLLVAATSAGGARGGSTHETEITVGVEWCRDISFVRSRCSREADEFDRLNSTPSTVDRRGRSDVSHQQSSYRRNEPWTGEGLSFLLDASAQVAEAASRGVPALRRTAAYLAPAQRGHWSIVDAVVGQRPTSWLPRILNRREAPEQRLERLVALSNRTHGARVAELLLQPSSHGAAAGGSRSGLRATASHRHGADLPVLVAVWCTSPWRLWSNLSTILLVAVLVWWWFRCY